MTPTPPLPPSIHQILYNTKNKYINNYLAFYLMLGEYGFERAIWEIFMERWENRWVNWFTVRVGTIDVFCIYSVRRVEGMSRLTFSVTGEKTKTLLKHPNLPQLTHLQPYISEHFKTVIPYLQTQFKKYNQK